MIAIATKYGKELLVSPLTATILFPIIISLALDGYYGIGVSVGMTLLELRKALAEEGDNLEWYVAGMGFFTTFLAPYLT